MSTKHKIKFSVFCTPEEHQKAWFTVQFRCGLLQFWWIILLSSVVLLGVTVNILLTEQIKDMLVWLIVFASLSFLIPVVYFSIVIPHVNKRRRHYLEKYMSIGERELIVFSHSISVASKMVSTDIPFSDCIFFLEKKEYFILIQNRRGYLIIPKRDIPQGEEEEVRERLKHGSLMYRLLHRG